MTIKIVCDYQVEFFIVIINYSRIDTMHWWAKKKHERSTILFHTVPLTALKIIIAAFGGGATLRMTVTRLRVTKKLRVIWRKKGEGR